LLAHHAMQLSAVLVHIKTIDPITGLVVKKTSLKGPSLIAIRVGSISLGRFELAAARILRLPLLTRALIFQPPKKALESGSWAGNFAV